MEASWFDTVIPPEVQYSLTDDQIVFAACCHSADDFIQEFCRRVENLG